MKSKMRMAVGICHVLSAPSSAVRAVSHAGACSQGPGQRVRAVCLPTASPVLSCEAATQTEGRPDLAAVTLRRGLRPRAARCRPQSLIDYKSYIDTKLLVARFLEQSSCAMTPDIHELVENIKSVLKSDEEHMEEAITSASFLEQVALILLSGLSQITRFHSSPNGRSEFLSQAR